MTELRKPLPPEVRGIRILADIAANWARAAEAEKELTDLQDLLAAGGQIKSVRLVHDGEGRTLGAIGTERTN